MKGKVEKLPEVWVVILTRLVMPQRRSKPSPIPLVNLAGSGEFAFIYVDHRKETYSAEIGKSSKEIDLVAFGSSYYPGIFERSKYSGSVLQLSDWILERWFQDEVWW